MSEDQEPKPKHVPVGIFLEGVGGNISSNTFVNVPNAIRVVSKNGAPVHGLRISGNAFTNIPVAPPPQPTPVEMAPPVQPAIHKAWHETGRGKIAVGVSIALIAALIIGLIGFAVRKEDQGQPQRPPQQQSTS